MNNVVAELDTIALQYEEGILDIGCDQFKQIEYLYLREDVLDLVPAIFSFSNSTTVLLSAIRALSHIIEGESIDENIDFIRSLLINYIPQFLDNKCIFKQLTKVLSVIATKQFPAEWPDFIDYIVSSDPPNFYLLSEFLLNIKDKYDGPAHSKASVNIIKNEFVPIIKHIIDYFPENYSKNALESIISMTSWDVLAEAHIEIIFEKECEKSYSVYSSLCLVDQIPVDILNIIFTKLLDNASEEYVCEIEDIIKFRFEMLNDDNVIRACQLFLADEANFDSHIDLWEMLILLIYKNFSDGSSKMLEKYSEIVHSVRSLLVRNFTNPPDLIYGEADISTRDEMNYILFKQMHRMEYCFLEIDSESFYGEIMSAIEEASSDLDIYYSVVNIVSQLSEVPQEIISELLEISFAHWQNPESNILMRVSFLYLCTKLIKKDLIDSAYIEDIANAALGYLTDPKQGKMASNLLLQLSQNYPEVLLEDFTPNYLFSLNLRNDIFTTASESLINILIEAENSEIMVDEISQKWNSVFEAGISLDSLDNLIKVLCALKGIASAGVDGVQELVEEILPQLEDITDEIASKICQLYEENPAGALQRYDVRSMVSVIRLQIQLYIESNVLMSFHILELLAECPPEFRVNEAFDLCLYILSSDPSEENINSIRETILGPFEEDFINNGNENLSQQNMCMKMIYIIAKVSPELITEEDLHYVISNIVRRWTTVSEFSIETAGKIFKRAKNNKDLLLQFIPDIISALIIKLAEISNLGHIEQIIRFIHEINISGVSFSDSIPNIVEAITKRLTFMDEAEVTTMLNEILNQKNIESIRSQIQKLASKLEQIPLYQVEKHIFITTLQREINSRFELE